jgi:zinc transport system substrate-binding protein
MKRFLLFLFALPVLAACNQAADSPAEKVITVSIEPLRYFTEAIAGDRFRVVTLVPHGSSPETYEPAPRQLVDLSESSAYLSVGGLGFEQTWMGKLAENVPQMPIVNLSKGIAPCAATTGRA